MYISDFAVDWGSVNLLRISIVLHFGEDQFGHQLSN